MIIFIIKLVSISKLNNFKLKFIYFKFFFLILVNDFIFFPENLNLLYFLCSKYSNFLLNFFSINLYYKPGLNSVDIFYIKDFFYSLFFYINNFILVGYISIILLLKKD